MKKEILEKREAQKKREAEKMRQEIKEFLDRYPRTIEAFRKV